MHIRFSHRARVIMLAAVAVLSARFPALGATPGTFEIVANMSEGRHGHTATLLADGTVLVAGGETGSMQSGGFYLVDSAERFYPKTNTFVPVGSMGTERVAHTAVRLQDGRVLVLGGVDRTRPSPASAEIFDPATNQFTPVGAMTEPRILAVATVLQDGQVLVVGGLGGTGGNTALKTAELFDPKSEKFETTGSLVKVRQWPTVVALADGRVAVLGGGYRAGEIYEPSTGRFIEYGQLATARSEAFGIPLPDGKILVVGGNNPNIEAYDPAAGQSVVMGKLRARRVAETVVPLSDGRVLVAGGLPGYVNSAPIKEVELVDPATGQVTLTGAMAIPRREGMGVLLPDGRALIFGGAALGKGALTSVEEYHYVNDPAPGG
jgi:hypothetical protein